MNIIHIMSGGDIGGAKTHIMSLVSELGKNNNVLLISLREGVFVKEARQQGINVQCVDNTNILKSYGCIKRIITKFSPDIIHLHGAKANLIGSMIKYNIPIVTTVHSDYKSDYLGNPLKQLTFGNINAISLRKLDFYQPVSDKMADVLIDRGFNPQKIIRIYNGMQFNPIGDDFDRISYLKEKFDVSINDDTIVCALAARLTAIKDIETAMRGFASALSNNNNLFFLIAGTGEDLGKLKNLSAELKIEKQVKFCLWVDDMDKFFACTDINILSSLSEGLPYSVLEGAVQKCATITTNVGGLPELIKHAENGLLFNPKDINMLSDSISFLANNEKHRQKIANNLYEKVLNIYSSTSVCETQINNYKHMIKSYNNNKGVVLCGAYGKGNSGDEAILKSINIELHSVDSTMPIWVISRNVKETRAIHKVNSLYTFNFFTMMKKFKNADVYINGGGSLIQDVTSTRSLYYYLFTIFLAKKLGCKVMMYGCGIGPVSLARNRKLAAKIINKYVDVITLRDDISREELGRMGANKPKIIMSADPTLILSGASATALEDALEIENIDLSKNYIGFGLRKWTSFDSVIDEIVGSAEYAFEKYGLIPLFIPIEFPGDVYVAEKVAKKLKCPYKIIKNRHPIEVTISILSKMKCVVGIRLHSLMFSAGRGVPVVGLSYDVKVDGFLKYIGAENCIKLEDIKAANINICIDNCMSGGLDDSIKNTASMLLERESLNTSELKKLLGVD